MLYSPPRLFFYEPLMQGLCQRIVDILLMSGISTRNTDRQEDRFYIQVNDTAIQTTAYKLVWTNPYHPQTDDLVVRFNKTLKMMLRKFITGKGKDWDLLIPYFLFAYWEVYHNPPQVSDLSITVWQMCPWHPGCLLRNMEIWWKFWWECGMYVLSIQERLVKLAGLVQQNLTAS